MPLFYPVANFLHHHLDLVVVGVSSLNEGKLYNGLEEFAGVVLESGETGEGREEGFGGDITGHGMAEKLRGEAGSANDEVDEELHFVMDGLHFGCNPFPIDGFVMTEYFPVFGGDRVVGRHPVVDGLLRASREGHIPVVGGGAAETRETVIDEFGGGSDVVHATGEKGEAAKTSGVSSWHHTEVEDVTGESAGCVWTDDVELLVFVVKG